MDGLCRPLELERFLKLSQPPFTFEYAGIVKLPKITHTHISIIIIIIIITILWPMSHLQTWRGRFYYNCNRTPGDAQDVLA